MFARFIILIAALAACCTAGVVPAVPAALTYGTYASSYNAHAVNHAFAAPYLAAPAIAAAPYVAAAPAVAAAPFAYPALGAYSVPPYVFRR